MSQGRIDRFLWIVRPENIERSVQFAKNTFGVDFDHWLGRPFSLNPDSRGVQSYISWDAGLEFIAPLGDDEASRPLQQFLDAHGEGPLGLVFGVDDLEKAAARGAAAGCSVMGAAQNSPDNAPRAGLANWTSKVTDYDELMLGEVLGTHVALGKVKYIRTAPPRRRIDHFIWVARPENVERYVKLISEALGAEFDHCNGPSYEAPSFSIHSYMSWESGLEVVAPVGDDDPVASHFQEFLAQHGEGPYGFVFGVDDLDDAAARARAAGHQVSGLLQTPDTDLRQALLRRWTTKVTDCREMLVGEMFGIRAMIGSFVYADPTHMY
jgi:predicted enzyme related to lactoylglutathione lyase